MPRPPDVAPCTRCTIASKPQRSVMNSKQRRARRARQQKDAETENRIENTNPPIKELEEEMASGSSSNAALVDNVRQRQFSVGPVAPPRREVTVLTGGANRGAELNVP